VLPAYHKAAKYDMVLYGYAERKEVILPMAEKTRKQALIEKRNTLNILIRQEQNKEAAGKRKADTRRKILVGAAILNEAEKKPDIKTFLYKLLDSFLTRPDDRALFDLPALPDKEAEKEGEK
jgi:hypothetical protein